MTERLTDTKELISRAIMAQRRGCPLVAIETTNPRPLMTGIAKALEDEGDCEEGQEPPGLPCVAWDIIQGLWPVNDLGQAAIEVALAASGGQPDAMLASLPGGGKDITQKNPGKLVEVMLNMPEDTVLVMLNAHKYLSDPVVLQGIWNARDFYKTTGRVLLMLCPSFPLPPELHDDVIIWEESLPEDEEIGQIIGKVNSDQGFESNGEDMQRAIDACRGMNQFATEQSVALALDAGTGMNIDRLWETKRKVISSTPGLSVYRGDENFSSTGGVASIKEYLADIINGNESPGGIIRLDEIEKALSGEGDTSGVNQDQLGTILSHMEDFMAEGLLFVGHPGCSKSLVAKGAGALGGIPTIDLDLGACKGSLVSQSEQQIRNALKVIEGVTGGRSLWIATCNSLDSIPAALRRRFTLGIYFFDMPTKEERAEIWDIHIKSYHDRAKDRGLEFKPSQTKIIPDAEYSGAEIRNIVKTAYKTRRTLKEASKRTVPMSVSNAGEIHALRVKADGNWLSASNDGPYLLPTNNKATGKKRQVKL